jgi:hypothetical protein
LRGLWVLPLLALSGCYYPYGPYHGYGGYPYPAYPYGYVPPYYAPGPPPPSYGTPQLSPDAQQRYYRNAQPGYGGPAASDPNNCGTPDEPKPCYGRFR